jgi:tRNA(Ile)-lysidine synthetase-like protein
MYHILVHELTERVLGHIRREELLRAGDRVGVAVSGGIDSVALLRWLVELRQEIGIVLSVVHFNHKLRGAESEADQEFVAGLAREHGLEFYLASGDVAQLAAEEHSGVEAAARELRYGFFRELLGSGESVGGLGTSGAKAQNSEFIYRSAESAAPPKGFPPPESVPQGLKPAPVGGPFGTAEAVPFPILPAAEAAPFQRHNPLREHSLRRQSSQQALDKIVTGHTLDDQAETVLMRVIRGTGMRGLGGIYPRIVVEHEDGEGHGEIVRPLLGIRRRELEQYLVDLKQPWREDSSNADSRFTRNRLRKLVLPLLEREFNPSVVQGFSELAEIARDEEDYWENEISGWLGTVVQWSQPEWASGLLGFDGAHGLVQILPLDSPGLDEADETEASATGVVETPRGVRGGASGQGVLRSAQDDRDLRLEQPGPAVMNASVSRPWLLTEPKAVQRRVLKAVGEQAGIPLEFKHIEEILRFAAEDGPAGKELSLPLGWKIRREPEAMVFITPDLRREERIPDYEYPLAVPGRAFVPEAGVVIEALLVTPEMALESQFAEYNPQQLLRAELLRSELVSGRLMVRNWRPGDRFWPAHTKAPKKIKELLQERRVAQPGRRLWPVAVSRDEIVWMRGFPVPAALLAKAGQEAVLIREIPWAGTEGTFNREER